MYVVYRVLYDYDYDEEYVKMRVFANKADAEAYREEHKARNGKYLYNLVEEAVL